MPTLLQLQAETWWAAEYQPPAIADLCAKLRAHYGVDAFALGSKGDANHLYGYHRSAAWVLNSRYCTNRSYSVTETSGNRAPGDPNWLCAVDATLPYAELLAACQRLDAAVRSGRLEKITEWYGNKDGDQRVDGYNNIANAVASSDDSHLWHLHMSFDRGRANENHDDVFAVLTGTQQGDDDMPKIFRVDQTGVTGVTSGSTWSYLASLEAVSAACRLWGIKEGLDRDGGGIVAINEADVAGMGQQVFPPSSGGGGAGPVSGPVDLSAKALDDIEKRVDRQLDQQSRGGVDND